MAIIGNNRDALLHGLSDFWLKYFKDVGDLKALYEGTEILLGQTYLNLLSDVLNAAVIETPLFKKEYYRLITIRSDQLNGENEFVADVPFGRLPALQNKLLAATDVLEEGVDYTVSGATIRFTSPLFDASGAPLLSQFAYRELDGVGQLAFWAVDAEVDQYDLYYRFGHYFSDKRRSSEMYRMFIRGIMQLYVLGPAIERVESALNVIAGLPVTREDGEVINAVESDATLNVTRVTTDRNIYDFPYGTRLRAAIVPGYALSAFEPLSDAIRVTDYISDPEWWHHITIPEALLPDVALQDRVVTPALAVNKIGATQETGYARIGDPEFRIGPAPQFRWDDAIQAYVDEVLGVPAEPTPAYRNRAAFVLMDRFLKMHIFGVTIEQRVEVSGVLVSDLRALLEDAKPTHTYLYLQAGMTMDDAVAMLDELGANDAWVTARPDLEDALTEGDTHWKIGNLQIGGGYAFNASFGAAPEYPVTTGMRLIIGGPDPTNQPTTGVFDLMNTTPREITLPAAGLNNYFAITYKPADYPADSWDQISFGMYADEGKLPVDGLSDDGAAVPVVYGWNTSAVTVANRVGDLCVGVDQNGQGGPYTLGTPYQFGLIYRNTAALGRESGPLKFATSLGKLVTIPKPPVIRSITRTLISGLNYHYVVRGQGFADATLEPAWGGATIWPNWIWGIRLRAYSAAMGVVSNAAVSNLVVTSDTQLEFDGGAIFISTGPMAIELEANGAAWKPNGRGSLKATHYFKSW